MVEYWGLPASIARAIALPQDGRSEIERSPHEKTLTQIVHVAERLTEFLLQGRAVLLSEVIDLMERTPTGVLTHLEQVMDALEGRSRRYSICWPRSPCSRRTTALFCSRPTSC